MTEGEMVGWHHRLGGLEFEQAPGVGDGQRSLACCSPWGGGESDMTDLSNYNVTGTKAARNRQVFCCLGGQPDDFHRHQEI